MRLWGPWIVRGSLLNTSVSSQTGFIPNFSNVQIPLSPYTFYPASLHSRAGTVLWPTIVFGALIDVDADNPIMQFNNLMGSPVSYAAEWRHINP